MFKSLFISCDQATTICDKSQYGEASFFDKIKLQFHFLRCKICALYTKQNSIITKICNQELKGDKQKIKTALNEEEKNVLKKQLLKNK